MLQGQEQHEHHDDDHPARPDEECHPGSGPVAVHLADNSATFGTLGQALEAQGFRVDDDLDVTFDRLARDASARLVVVYPNPVMVVGNRLQAGDPLPEAINAWRGAAGRLLKGFRRNRRRTTLVDGHAALLDLPLFLRLLGSRLSLATGAAAEIQTDVEPVGLLHLMAAQALRQNESAATLLAELEASSLPLGLAYRVDVNGIIEQEFAGASASEQEELRKDNERLRHQLNRVQAELEAHFLESRKLDEFIEAARKAELARQSLQQEFNEAREAWSDERKALSDKLTWSANDLAAIRRSLSWRLTAPLRRVLGLFVGDTKL